MDSVQTRNVFQRLRTSCAIAYVILVAGAAHGWAGPQSNKTDDLAGFEDVKPASSSKDASAKGKGSKASSSSDDLALFDDIPVVISAGRREQRLTASSIPISVITSQDIRYGGSTNIAEALRYAPGIDVLRLDRNRYAVGVRGMHHEFADRTLVLINGRDTADLSSGGVDWLEMPVMLDDIDRIEIVRGPGGAVWGANAFNGVINILTRKPEDSQGLSLSSTLNEYGDSWSQLRWGASAGNFAWRISAGYQESESSQDAMSGESFVSHDFLRGSKFDGEGVYGVNSDTKLRFGFAQSHQERGPSEFVGYLPDRDGRRDTERFFARLEHTFSKDVTGHLQWYTNLRSIDNPSLVRMSQAEHDLEGQINFAACADHQVSIGGNIRLTRIDVTGTDPQQVQLIGEPFDETWAGLFITDRWQMSSQFALESQLRGDTYSGTGNDWSGRITGLYSLDKDHRHTMRLGFAKAFRAPPVGLRNLFSSYPPPPGTPPFITELDTIGNPNVHNEQIYSLEAGYIGELGDGWVLRTDAYYQHLSDVAGFADIIAPPASISYYDNLGEANASGIEAEISYTHERNKATAFVAYNGFGTELPNQETRSYYPARLKFGATGRAGMGENWTLNANYAFTSITHRESDGDRVPMIHSLDLSIARKLLSGKAEIQIGINDVFDRTGPAFLPLGSFTSHETPGRTLYATFRASF